MPHLAGEFDHPVRFATGGAPPAPTTIAAMREPRHQGHPSLRADRDLWPFDHLRGSAANGRTWTTQSLAHAIARQGVRTVNVESVRVVDESFADVPRDGETHRARSSSARTRWCLDITGTSREPNEAIRDGWLFTGDLAVMHPDGYLEVRDRSKDIIISGGENISSIEVENTLLSHPAVSEAAVVASPHPTWGEVPVAFVTLRPEQEVSAADLIEYVRARLAHFKAPKAVVFTSLPKTSTGKVQKYELRTTAKSLTFPGKASDT